VTAGATAAVHAGPPAASSALMGGAWSAADAFGTFAVRDPADDHVVGRVHDVPVSAVDAAVGSARAGFRSWSAVAPRRRAEILHRAAELTMERREELARTITREMGKPLAEARGEVDYAAGYLREYAEHAPRIGGRSARREDGPGSFVTEVVPVGIAVLVTPWNFPLAMGARKLAPALAAGCAAIVKPADRTPLSMLAFAAVLLEAGVHPEAVTVLPTTDSPGVVAALIDHPATAKLSFTGSTAVGRELARRGGHRLLRMSMELGGNAPFVVCADADVESAIRGAVVAKFRNGGQACTAANRFLVAEEVAGAFTAGLGRAAQALRAGAGLDDGVQIGPMIDASAARRIGGLVDEAIADGARVVATGPTGDSPSHVPATVLADVPPASRIARDEIFGPVAAITTFRDEAEAIRLANDTPYGLAAYVFSRDADRLARVGRALRAGMVGANTGSLADPAAPFGGVGDSGFGREGGPEGLAEYTELRYVASPG